VGATKRPAYRVIAIDKRRSRDGRALEILGFYDPLTEPATVQLETDRINAWIGKGALPSDTVLKLMRQADAAAKGEVTERPKRATRPPKPSKKALARAAAAAAAPAVEGAPATEAVSPSEAAESTAHADPGEATAAAAESDEVATPEKPEVDAPAADDSPATEEAPAAEESRAAEATPVADDIDEEAPDAEKADA
jgi:small subunit ribosomal protein S16